LISLPTLALFRLSLHDALPIFAIVEFQAWPQLEFVGLAVRALGPGLGEAGAHLVPGIRAHQRIVDRIEHAERGDLRRSGRGVERSEEHTSELQSLTNLVCRLLL